mmetsp:Transcript_17534/g.55483  ORF Transcript_17534/g.55483 Transcript_17534/m.55483 type:complete len:217 (-) Transcript_17534:181-831(-)
MLGAAVSAVVIGVATIGPEQVAAPRVPKTAAKERVLAHLMTQRSLLEPCLRLSPLIRSGISSRSSGPSHTWTSNTTRTVASAASALSLLRAWTLWKRLWQIQATTIWMESGWMLSLQQGATRERATRVARATRAARAARAAIKVARARVARVSTVGPAAASVGASGPAATCGAARVAPVLARGAVGAGEHQQMPWPVRKLMQRVQLHVTSLHVAAS